MRATSFRHFARHRCTAAILIALAVPAAAYAQAPQEARDVPESQAITYRFDIPVQPLSDALQAFARASRQQVSFDSMALAGVAGNALAGSYTAEEALQRLLDGTGINFRRGAQGVWMVDAAEDEADSDRGGNAQLAVNPGQTAASSGVGGRVAQIDTVMVTATKRTQSAREIPMSISVISQEDLERSSAIGMEDYLRAIPGVNQIDNGGISNAIIIRGVTTSPVFENFSSGTTVATYFDETPITGAGGAGAGGIDIRPVDIERIEVLRGPQGTAYGSSSLGGTMRMIPARPDLHSFSAKALASWSDTAAYGSGNSMQQAVINMPIADGRFALRAVGYRYDESGFYRNLLAQDPARMAIARNFGLEDYIDGYTRRDVGRMRTSGARIAALWQATDRLDITANLLRQSIEQDGSPMAATGKFDQARWFVVPEGRVRGEQGEIYDTNIELANMVLNYDLAWGTLTSTASRVEGGSIWASGSTQDPRSTTSPSDYRSDTFETRFASRLRGPLQFLVGAFNEDVKEEYGEDAYWPGTPETNPVGTNPMHHLEMWRYVKQKAAFGELTYEFTDRWSATLGGRYFHYDKGETSIREGGSYGVPLGGGLPVSVRTEDSGTSYKASLNFKPSDDALIYASWAEGFRLGRATPGLAPELCDLDGDGIVDGTNTSIEATKTVDSDFLDSYEVGAKVMLFDRRMALDFSAFRIEWDGLPIRDIAPGCGLAYVGNVGSATSNGLELQSSVYLMEGLRLDFGAGFTRAELAADAPGLNAVKGARLPGSPRKSANLGFQYDFDFHGKEAFARMDTLYAGSFYGNLQETAATKAGGYYKVDVRTGIRFERTSMEIFVRNLTNREDFTWRDASRSHRLRPRTVGVQVGYHFD